MLEQRHGVYSNANELGLKWTTSRPPHPPGHFEVPDRLISKYFRKLLDVLYEDNDKPVPSVSVILFLAGDEAFDKNAKTLILRIDISRSETNQMRTTRRWSLPNE